VILRPIGRLEDSDAVRWPDEVGAIEDVEEHHTIGRLADPWNLDFSGRAQIDLTDVRNSLGVGEAGAQPSVEKPIHREQPIPPSIRRPA